VFAVLVFLEPDGTLGLTLKYEILNIIVTSRKIKCQLKLSFASSALYQLSYTTTAFRNITYCINQTSLMLQVIGHCEFPSKTIILTEDCRKYGSLYNFVKKQMIVKFSAMERLQIVIQLIECFVFLHYKSGSSKVHCDLHNPLQVNLALLCYIAMKQ